MSTPRFASPDSGDAPADPGGRFTGDEHRTASRRCVIILAMTWLVVVAATARTASRGGGAIVDDAPPGTVDPNVAAWHELTVLPRIGRSKAEAIVTYRDRLTRDGHVAFTRPVDLTAVSGIGPKTVQRIARDLHFTEHDR